MKVGNKIQYAIKTEINNKLKIKPATIIKIFSDKIYLDTFAILYI